ncbi:NlpC/P60 family protein [Paraburkholderia silviterrae]|uniref:Peptidoglycan endopeptidase n=1 Tax=Paraburkholderia silviterrae TaxID=2528715 RepID=A0A4R5MES7_9BURK|nr:C40 family peptidase [Paraburkholderia silviterrae]TDG25414.1 peptidoglycan endopeptidase [Paraburkholderia silviterrae]
MRRLWLPLLIVVFLAACSSTPQKTSRSGGSSSGADAWRTRPPGFPNFVDHSVGREEISIQAMSLVGIPYRWGGNTPDSGFDCSGLVKYVFSRSAQVDLPRTTADMSQRGETIDPDEIAAGDLVFFNTTGRPHSHVGIYVGKLRFVNAPSTGGTVRLDYLTNPYWAKHFDGIRRMAPPKRAPTTPFDTPTWEASAPAPATPAVAAIAPAVTPATAPVTPSAAPPNATVAALPAASAAPAPRMATTDQSRLTSTPQAAYAGAAPTSGATSAAPADAFEPPPAALGAAQVQAREAGAVAPPVTPATSAVAPSAAPRDAINAAADAFEPPPSGVRAAERQAAQAGSTPVVSAPSSGAPVQIMRASTASGSTPAPTPMPMPTQSSDDPIARFANGSY